MSFTDLCCLTCLRSGPSTSCVYVEGGSTGLGISRPLEGWSAGFASDLTHMTWIDFLPAIVHPRLLRSKRFSCLDDERPLAHAPAAARESTTKTHLCGRWHECTMSTSSRYIMRVSSMLICCLCAKVQLSVLTQGLIAKNRFKFTGSTRHRAFRYETSMRPVKSNMFALMLCKAIKGLGKRRCGPCSHSPSPT